jgi:hypothetical protein
VTTLEWLLVYRLYGHAATSSTWTGLELLRELYEVQSSTTHGEPVFRVNTKELPIPDESEPRRFVRKSSALPLQDGVLTLSRFHVPPRAIHKYPWTAIRELLLSGELLL